MTGSPQGFSDFIPQLSGSTVGLIYCFSNRVNLEETWYDRWRSDVIFFFGRGVEQLDAEPHYVDVDLYLEIMAKKDRDLGDYIINLNSGLLNIASWPIVSASASWARIPIAPCASDVHIVGERKDLTNLLARQTALKVPHDWFAEAAPEALYVVKPRDLGMSRDLTVRRGRDIEDVSPRTHVVQEFVRGYDATVGLLLLPNGAYSVIGAEIIIPTGDDAESWIFSEDCKVAGVAPESAERRMITVDASLRQELYRLCVSIGRSTVYRIDIRVTHTGGAVPELLSLENSYFLEANPTPTVGRQGGYADLLIRFLAPESQERFDADMHTVEILKDLGPEAAIVALMLYNSVANA